MCAHVLLSRNTQWQRRMEARDYVQWYALDVRGWAGVSAAECTNSQPEEDQLLIVESDRKQVHSHKVTGKLSPGPHP